MWEAPRMGRFPLSFLLELQTHKEHPHGKLPLRSA